MTIKHLVISGGGPLGLRFLGALEKLQQEHFWDFNNIESIYATSIGSIIGAFICLKYDWETLKKYIIERPWHDAFKVNAKQIFDSYYNKGLFDKKIAEIIFKPLLEAKDLSLNITLKEFFNFSKIDLHIFTFELNTFKTVELSHTLFPELTLIQALTMSSSLPGIFSPTIIDNSCFIDGGILCNYPINECLRNHTNKEEILAFKIAYENNNTQNIQVTNESSVLEYIICMSINSVNYIRNTIKFESIDNTVNCYINDNPLTLHFIQESIRNSELRRDWIKMGEDDANKFLENK